MEKKGLKVVLTAPTGNPLANATIHTAHIG